jgi:membrane-associated protease RseP (regulator of RpoE activity)
LSLNPKPRTRGNDHEINPTESRFHRFTRRGCGYGDPQPTTYIGVIIEPVPDVLRDYVDLPKGVGLLLPKVSEDGPAAKAGIQDNDILVSFDGQLVVNYNQFSTLLNMKGAGATVPVKILRKGEEMTFEVTLEERMRRGMHIIAPHAPDAPDVPGVPDVPGIDEIGAIMESVEEWIPGSVRVFVDQNEQVHVDLQDLKEDLQGLQKKLAVVHVMKDGAPELVTKHGDHGARTTLVRVADRNVTYEGDKGKVVLKSTKSGKQATVWNAGGELIYEGDVPEDYAEALPPEAVELLDSLKVLDLGASSDEIEIHLNVENIDPVTVLSD